MYFDSQAKTNVHLENQLFSQHNNDYGPPPSSWNFHYNKTHFFRDQSVYID